MPRCALILVLESDPTQAATIRHIVCDIVGAELTMVESIDHVIRALDTTTPDLVLLPPLVSPGEEAKLVTFLRTHPQGAHVETLIAPVLSHPRIHTTPTLRRWRKWGTSRTPGASDIDETRAFADRLTWSLRAARERRQPEDGDGGVANDAGSSPTPSPEVVAPVEVEELAPLVHAPAADRRAHQRFQARELQALRASRIKSGPLVSLLDVSTGGALLECDAPLATESEAVLELVTDLLQAHYVPFRVVRSHVATRGRISRYIEACAFLTPLDIGSLQGHTARSDAPRLDADGLDDLRAILDPYLVSSESAHQVPSLVSTDNLATGTAERRRHMRVNGPFDGCRRGVIDVPIMIHNLSEGGCFIDSRLDAEPGHRLTLGLRSSSEGWLTVKAEVVHAQLGVGFAVRFVDVPDATRIDLERIVATRAPHLEPGEAIPA